MIEKLPELALLLAWILVYIPRGFVAQEQAKQQEGYDNDNPRAQQARLAGLGARAQAAHMNGFEAFAPFAAAVLLCRTTGVQSLALPIACGLFVLARSAYIGAYLGNRSTLRSGLWTVGALATLVLFLLPLLR